MNRNRKTKGILICALVAAGVLLATTRDANTDFKFGTPTNLEPPLNGSRDDWGPSISADGLELYFDSNRSGGLGGYDLWVATRTTTHEPWGEPVNLGSAVNGSDWEQSPSISADGLSLFFSSRRPGGYGSWDLWVATRATRDTEWSSAVNLGWTVNSSAMDLAPGISPDGLSLFFGSRRDGGFGAMDLWLTTRETPHSDWGTPVNLGSTVNSEFDETEAKISADGRTLIVGNSGLGPFRPGGYGNADLWFATRATPSDTWGALINLGPAVNSPSYDLTHCLAPDGSTLYFASNRPGGYGEVDMWQVSINPVFDFNGDGKVNLQDLSRLAQHWGENETSCDIAPPPLGDNMVGIEDVATLAEYWLTCPGVVAHWALDETEGSVAHDSAGDFDGTLINGPVWQPTGGKVAGALQFDGIDDHVNAGFVLNPGDGPFSACAWVKGGQPGGVIISQTDVAGFGATWLGANPSDGTLITNLMFFEMKSESLITDDTWHHVAIAWDGSRRHLYVDGQEVAKDTSNVFGIPSDGDLHVGAGKDLAAGSFWSGLIDDVMIYDRAIVP